MFSFRADKRDGSVQAAAEASTASNTKSFDQATKAARFAKDFTESDLETLCALCVNPGNVPLVFTHIRRVLRVTEPGRANEMAAKSRTTRWSSDRLDMEIGRSNDDESDLGGPRLTPTTRPERRTGEGPIPDRAWLKRYDEIWQHAEQWPPKLPLGEMDARQLSGRLRKEQERLARLASAVKDVAEAAR